MQECLVISTSKGWLEFGAYIPNIVEERKVGEKASMERTNKYLEKQMEDKFMVFVYVGASGLSVFFTAIKLFWKGDLW